MDPTTETPSATNNVIEERVPQSMNKPFTPAVLKRRQILRQGKLLQSPTDSLQSPCTQRLGKRIAKLKRPLNDNGLFNDPQPE